MELIMELKKTESYVLSFDNAELGKLLFALQWIAEIKDSIVVSEKSIDKAVSLKTFATLQDLLEEVGHV